AHGRKHTRRLGPAGGACTCRLRRKLRAGAQGTAQKLAGSTLRTWLPKSACVRGNVDPTAPRTIEWPDVRFTGLPRSLLIRAVPLVTLGLLSSVGLSGCISAQSYKNTMSGQITHMPARAPIDANVGLEVHHTLAPRMRSVWKAWLNGDGEIANYELAVTELLREELVNDRLFSGTFLGGATTSDLLVSVASVEDKDDERYWVVVTLTVRNPRTRVALATYRRRQVTATSILAHNPLHAIPSL